jgi:hypothetical protein
MHKEAYKVTVDIVRGVNLNCMTINLILNNYVWFFYDYKSNADQLCMVI